MLTLYPDQWNLAAYIMIVDLFAMLLLLLQSIQQHCSIIQHSSVAKHTA